MNPNLRFVRTLLYSLKREYGQHVDLYRLTNSVLNTETGVKTQTIQKITVWKCIVLSGDMIRSFAYGHSFLAADRNFAYGGKFDVGTKGFIIDIQDLPSGFQIDMDDYLVYEGKRYDMKKVTKTDDGYAFATLGKEVEGGTVGQIHELSLFTTLRLIQKSTCNFTYFMSASNAFAVSGIATGVDTP